MSTVRKILHSTLVPMLGKAIVTVVALLFITRPLTLLGDEFYGEYAFVYRFLGFFAIFADFGLFTIAVREMSARPAERDKILSNIFGLRIVLVTTVMVIAGLSGLLLGYFYPEKFTLPVEIGLWLAGLSVVFTMMDTTLTSIFQVNYQMNWPTIGNVVGKIVMAIVVMWAISRATLYPDTATFWQNDFHWFFTAGVLGNLAALLLVWYFAHKLLNTRPRFDHKFWRTSLLTALPYGLALILNTFHFQLDSVMLFFLRPDGAAEVGAYDVAFKVLEILNIIPIYFLNAVLPILTAAQGNPALAKKIVDYCWRFLLALAAPIFFGGAVVAPHIVAIVVQNPETGYFAQSPMALTLLLASLVFIFLNSLFGFTLVAQGRQNALLWVNLAALLCNFFSNLIMIPLYGLIGAGITTIFSEAVVLILGYYTVRQKMKVSIPWIPTVKILLAGLGMYLALYPLREESLMLLLPLGGLIYGGLILALRSMPTEAWEMLRKDKKDPPPPPADYLDI